MIRRPGFILTVAVSLQVVSAIAAEQSTNGRMAATLAHAAADLAEGRYPAAGAGFDTVIRDKESPALARSLALLGMAQAAEAGNDSTVRSERGTNSLMTRRYRKPIALPLAF